MSGRDGEERPAFVMELVIVVVLDDGEAVL